MINENIQYNHLYFNAYDKVTENLKDFYSETLAKMKDDFGFSAKGTFNSIYNKILNDVLDNAVKGAISGEELDYDQITQDVKDQITAELESIDYSPRNWFAQ